MRINSKLFNLRFQSMARPDYPSHSWEQRRIQRKKRWQSLIDLLGGKCQRCGSKIDLSIEHINGRTWDVTAYSWPSRIARYWREYNQGVPLTCLCLTCNDKARDERRRQQEQEENEPF